jgi:hypothetical protein
VRSYLGVDRPEEFFLRPGLEPGKFPEHRSIHLSPELMERLRAQEEAGQLIFEVPKVVTFSAQQVAQRR